MLRMRTVWSPEYGRVNCSISASCEAAGLQALERKLGAEPAGIDQARVDQLRAAIADGSYTIDAQQIATRMLALDDALGR